MTDTWERRRQSKKGFKQRTLMIPEDVLRAVDKYTKQRNTTKRVIWDEVLRAGVAARAILP
jgi:hypothetical protein